MREATALQVIGTIVIWLYVCRLIQGSALLSVTLRQLEVFKKVVDAGSFSGAATALNISQPSVSMHVRALERRVRQLVFERHRGRAPVLTDIGRRIYDHAGDMLDQSDRASADIRSLQSTRDNVLSFASQRFIANHLLSKPLAVFARMHPGIEIIANIGVLEHVVENIRHRDVELGLFLARGAVRGLRSEVLGHQELVFVTASDHPLASRRGLTHGDLADFPFIGPVKGSQYGRLLNRIFAEIGLTEYATISQSQNTPIRKELIQSGIGFTCALRLGWEEDLAGGHVAALDVAGGPFSLEVRIGFLPDRQIGEASQQFVDYLNGLRAKGAFNS